MLASIEKRPTSPTSSSIANGRLGPTLPKPRLHAKPNRIEVNACRPWFDAGVERLDPAVVVCLGATAAQALLGSDFRVTRHHGRPIEFGTRWVVATLHPAAVLPSRGSEERQRQYGQLVADLEVAAGLVG